eukprot:3469358-Pyramimonas_sp.AAC.1
MGPERLRPAGLAGGRGGDQGQLPGSGDAAHLLARAGGEAVRGGVAVGRGYHEGRAVRVGGRQPWGAAKP